MIRRVFDAIMLLPPLNYLQRFSLVLVYYQMNTSTIALGPSCKVGL